jgi:hypothetical protein
MTVEPEDPQPRIHEENCGVRSGRCRAPGRGIISEDFGIAAMIAEKPDKTALAPMRGGRMDFW